MDFCSHMKPLACCELVLCSALLPTGQLLDPSAKRPKGDLDMVKRLPVMRLSMVVQRLIEMERRVSRIWSKHTALLVICGKHSAVYRALCGRLP
jgi:hypothetical protein